MSTERRHDIDWIRVIAIALLLIYHIAIIFQPWAMFIGFIRSDQLFESLWIPMTMLNVWRIPLLFFVSGMGFYFAMQKRSWKQLLIERTKRILIPFLFGILAITPLHMFIFQKHYKMPLDYFPHQGHLWFLLNIFIYVILLIFITQLIKKKISGKLKNVWILLMKNPFGPIAVSVFFVIEALIVNPQLYALYANTWHGFFLGLLAFFFGFIFVSSGKTFWTTVQKWWWLYLSLAFTLYCVRYHYFSTEGPGYLTAVESNCWIVAIFGLGYKYMNRPSKILSYLSKAAYPIYIIHMFVLYLGALILLPLELPVSIKFLAITCFTFLICFLIYELIIKRVPLIRPLFGLKWRYKLKEKS